MTISTTRPDATVDNAGVVASTGTVHGVLSDDSDSTYVDSFGIGDYVQTGFAEPTIPAASVIKSAVIRARIARSTPGAHTIGFYFVVSGTIVPVTPTITWTSPTTITVTPTLTQAQLEELASTMVVNVGGAGASNQTVLYELYVDTTHVAQPVATVNAPTGTITTTNTPLVDWTDTLDSDGGTQTAYEVKIFNAAQYGAGGFDPDTSTPYAESGITTGSAVSWQDTTILPDDSYRAYVRVAQTVNGSYHWSDWDYEAFTVDVLLPAVPLLTVTAENDDARVRIDIDHLTGDATTDALEIQRSTDNLTWEALRLTTDTDGIIAASDATVYDMEGGNAQTVYYRARALHNYSGQYAASAWATDDTAWTSTTWWLKSVQHPSMNIPVYPHSVPSYQRPARQGVFQALSARRAIVVSDTRGADRGTLVLRVDTDSEAAALDDLIDYGAILLLQGIHGEHWTDRYVVLGDLDRARLVDKAFVQGTLDTFTWVEVDAPTGVIDDWPDVGS